MTKALQQLEQESGVRLQRTTRRLYLTPEGKSFIVAANRCSPGRRSAGVVRADRPIRGQLRVDMPIAFARLLVIPHLSDFYQAHPEVEIVLSSSDVRRDMLRDGLDCLLRVGILRMATMWRVRWGGGVNHLRQSGYLARYGAPATLEDLQSHLAVNWVNSSSRQIMPGDSRPRRASGRSPFPVNWCWTTLKSLLLPGWRGWGCCRGCVSFATLYRQRATGGSFAGLSGAASTVVAALSAPASLA